MGYSVQNIVTWYQKKIGTYDKQQWEKTVEQRILSGFTHVPMKTAKLKTDFIDLDLVRGSAFSKAKPKHGFIKVTKLATLRLLLLPFYYQWWICQTSSTIFISLLVLYALQIGNTAIFLHSWLTHDTANNLENVSASEVLTPIAIMLILSITHSQIVSTHSAIVNKKYDLQNKHNSLKSASINRRLKRVKRRMTNTVRSRPSHMYKSDPKLLSDIDGQHDILSDSKSISQPSDTSVLEYNSPVNNHLVLDVESGVDDTSGIRARHRIQKLRLSFGSSPGIQDLSQPSTPEAESPNSPSLEDDGFESLDSNGSSDGTREQRDISLTAAQYESVKGNTGSPNQNNANGLPANRRNTYCINDSRSCMRVSFSRILENSHSKEIETIKTKGPKINPNAKISSKDETDTDNGESDTSESCSVKKALLKKRRGSQQKTTSKSKNLPESSVNSSADESEEEQERLYTSGTYCPVLTEGTTSAGEWIGVTTNSEECSYSSELEGSDNQYEQITSFVASDNNDWELEMMPNVILNPSTSSCGKVSCTMWEQKEVKKANLSVLDISSAIIARVEEMPESMDYFYIGLAMSVMLALLPSMCRLMDSYDTKNQSNSIISEGFATSCLLASDAYCTAPVDSFSMTFKSFLTSAFGKTFVGNVLITITIVERFCLAAIFFFLLTVAERTFKQRFLYAKFFSHLTSFRRARKSQLPHFRLNKVRNIKTWLSVRSYLKKRGPQRSVDVIVSSAFLITVILISFLSVELLKDSEYNMEALAWCIMIGFYLLRFMTLGTKINKKYRNLSTIITEQINLYLQIEQKPNKKDELMVANNVLKLAADLLKELESPFKISGFSANPYLYTITKVVMLSALSGVLSEILGFKLKLHKIKVK